MPLPDGLFPLIAAVFKAVILVKTGDNDIFDRGDIRGGDGFDAFGPQMIQHSAQKGGFHLAANDAAAHQQGFDFGVIAADLRRGGNDDAMIAELVAGPPEHHHMIFIVHHGLDIALVIAPGRQVELVGSGGIRNGLDVAKSLVLGADVAGMALPVLRVYNKTGYDGVVAYISNVTEDLKKVMLLVGAGDISALKKHTPVITGRLSEWMKTKR